MGLLSHIPTRLLVDELSAREEVKYLVCPDTDHTFLATVFSKHGVDIARWGSSGPASILVVVE